MIPADHPAYEQAAAAICRYEFDQLIMDIGFNPEQPFSFSPFLPGSHETRMLSLAQSMTDFCTRESSSLGPLSFCYPTVYTSRTFENIESMIKDVKDYEDASTGYWLSRLKSGRFSDRLASRRIETTYNKILELMFKLRPN